MTRYESAKEIYAKLGVDTDAAIAKCKEIPVSLHCWQGDDVTGFDHDGPLTGGIQTTGNYPGKARTPEELLADMDKAMSLMPGKKKINVHACYGKYCYKGYRHSLCHGWASGVTAWITENILGVKILEPGCKKIKIQPQLGNLQWAKGTYPTPYGILVVEHRKDAEGKIKTDVKAPKEIEVIVEI